ncbi:MAG TPA: DUF2191 domain-containing protein [Terriglobia bacterium]|nr:DUF2191 domain-containing protein [Terriglobia bacterium]
MRTTIRLEEGLLRAAKAEAARRGETVTALIERGLRLVLAGNRSRRSLERVRLPVSHAKGGVRPGVDLNHTSSLIDMMEERR